MKKLTIILLAISFIAVSCKKDDSTIDIIPGVGTPTAGSITMTYDGQTFTDVDEYSLTLLNGIIAVAGTGAQEFLLTILGVGADGTTVEICTDDETCPNMCTLSLDFGAAVGLEALVATSGTIKRSGKTIEVNVIGITFAGDEKTLTATIVVSQVIDI
jgi:hypothetical protein